MKATTWSEDYKINSFMVNLRKRAGLYSILNIIQDAGWQHAIQMGAGHTSMGEQKLAWVVTRQELEMQRWPAWGETVTAVTWLRPVDKSSFVFRDVELLVGGVKIGECTTSYATIDMQTRRLTNVDFSLYEDFIRKDGHLTLTPPKLAAQEGLQDLASFQVRNSDLDMNDHVNNTRYAQWVLDSLPVEVLRTADLKSYAVNFNAETKSGDEITIQHLEPEVGSQPQFQGLRKADGKIVFIAQLRI